MFLLSPRAAEPPYYQSASSSGRGGSLVSSADGRMSCFYNPAGLNLFEDHLNLSVNGGFGLSSSIIGLATFAGENLKGFEDKSKLDSGFFKSAEEVENVWNYAAPYTDMTLNTKNFGVGFFWQPDIQFMLESGGFIPLIGTSINSDIMVTASAAKRLLKSVSGGITLKYMYVSRMSPSILSTPETINLAEELGENLGSTETLEKFIETKQGMGFDAGLIFHSGLIKTGAVFRDIFSVLDGKTVRMKLDLGTTWHVPYLIEKAPVKDFTVYLDFLDIFGPGSKTKSFHTGAEAAFRNFVFRTGLNQGYPVFGFSLMLGIFHFDYAFFQKETGIYAGQKPDISHTFGGGLDIAF